MNEADRNARTWGTSKFNFHFIGLTLYIFLVSRTFESTRFMQAHLTELWKLLRFCSVLRRMRSTLSQDCVKLVRFFREDLVYSLNFRFSTCAQSHHRDLRVLRILYTNTHVQICNTLRCSLVQVCRKRALAMKVAVIVSERLSMRFWQMTSHQVSYFSRFRVWKLLTIFVTCVLIRVNIFILSAYIFATL